MSRPYAFDDEDNDFTQSQQPDRDAAFKPMDIQKPRGFDDVKAGANSEFRAFGESAKKLTTAADAIKAAVESLKSGLEDALGDKAGIPAVKTDTTGATLDDVVDAIKNIKLAPADNKFDGPKSSKPDRSEPKLQQAQTPRPVPIQPKEFQTPGLKPVEPREFSGPELAKMTPREFSGPELTAEPPQEKLTPPVLQKREVEKPTFPENAKSDPREFKMKEPSFDSHGLIPGKDTTQDRVNVKAKSGEFIVRPEAVKAIGLRKLEEFNSLKQKPPEFHARGGLVGKDRPAVAFKTPERQPKAYSVGGIVASVIGGGVAGSHQSRPNEIGRSVVAGAFEGGMAGGPLGAATGAVVAGFKAVSATAKESAERLGKFNAGIATANAKANYRQITGNVQRADFLSPQLSRFTDVNSKLSQSGQNLEALFLKFGLRAVVPILEAMQKGIETYGGAISEHIAKMLEGMAAIVEVMGGLPGIGGSAADAAKMLDAMAGDIREMNFRGKNPDIKGGMDKFMKEFLDGHGMDDSKDAWGGPNGGGNQFRAVSEEDNALIRDIANRSF
ncbi:hypothetical protein UFOVP1229_100 [uncultured Caudovirales phage]|uniref:Uncharacterized protein n=1 Tax=uncultured Caudovirales phage TaxID=2100421 RepID=A0A6J5R474_9CAUD|nr:hypothetical protein UFOVP1229_100 [uncultured Caudovirales phage]